MKTPKRKAEKHPRLNLIAQSALPLKERGVAAAIVGWKQNAKRETPRTTQDPHESHTNS
jgi:hypothetical protein